MDSHAVAYNHTEAFAAFAALLEAQAPEDFSHDHPLWVAGAPEVLDVMGGIAECCGSLTITYPLAMGPTVGVQPRTDGQVCLLRLSDGDGHSPRRCCLPLQHVIDRNGHPTNARPWDDAVAVEDRAWAIPLVSALAHVRAESSPSVFERGVTLACAGGFDPQRPEPGGCALTTAAVLALAHGAGRDLKPVELATCTQRLQGQSHGLPLGLSEAACAAFGERDTLLKTGCQPFESLGSLPLPEGTALCGIDCGHENSDAATKYTRAQVTALMGREIIGRILAASDGHLAPWQGYLARINVNDYVELLRDRLPTRMKGQAYLDRFGGLEDPFAAIDPEAIYKIRSRTEHHIYENMRVHQFCQRLAQAGRTGNRSCLLEAGELMLASHWSYGQRCALGCITVDAVVTQLRNRGTAQGIYGARISGMGAGGMVVVLSDGTESSQAAIRESVSIIEERIARPLPICRGSLAGAHHRGVERFG